MQRKKDAKAFDEKEIWSVLCSCALAMTEMIRMEGRSHAALRTRDIRLTKEGVVKILSMEMVGIEVGQDAAEEGSTKQLAMTVLNCLLMEDVSNDAREFLEELIEAA